MTRPEQHEDPREPARTDLERDVHDHLGSLLTGVAFLAQSLLEDVPAELEPRAARLVSLLNEALASARDLAHRQGVLDPRAGTLPERLTALARDTADTFGVQCDFESFGDVGDLDVEARHAVFSIAREAVNNAVRHSRGHRISIALGREERRHVLVVTDDGVGLRAECSASGMGLHNMKHRARALGGVLELRQARGGGAEVWCAW